MFRVITFIFLLNFEILALAQTKSEQTSTSQGNLSFPDSNQLKNARLSFKIIPSEGSTWCYDILKDEKIFIHQPSIPGVKGNKGFITKEHATKVAELVIEKIKNGISPPTVTLEEMKKMDVY